MDGRPKNQAALGAEAPFRLRAATLAGRKGLALCGGVLWAACLQRVALKREAGGARASKARAARVRARAQRSFDLSLGRLVWTAAAGLAEAKARLDCPELGSRQDVEQG